MFSRILSLAMIAVTCAVAPCGVQAQGGRFFTPLVDVGSQQQSQGLYGSLEAIYWNISAPAETQIGYTNPDGSGGSRDVYLGGRAFTQHNSLTTAALGEAQSSFGMRFEIGNNRDHHGWLISAYGLPSQKSSKNIIGSTSMVIKDDGFWDANSPSWIWDPQRELETINGLNTMRWGVFSGSTSFSDDGIYSGWAGDTDPPVYGTPENLGPGNPALGGTAWIGGPGGASLQPHNYPAGPLYFQGISASGMSGSVYELTEHAVRPGLLWGYIPLAVEEQGYLSWNSLTRPYHAEINRTILYAGVAPLPIIFSNVSITSQTDNWSGEAMYTYRLHPLRWMGVEFLAGLRYWQLGEDFTFAGAGESRYDVVGGNGVVVDTFSMSILNATSINSSAYNRVVGPQLGVRLQRNNERWSALAEFRLFTGINSIEMKNSGLFATGIAGAGSSGYVPGQTLTGEASSFIGRSSAYRYNKTRQEFSPGFELRLNASWRLTRQIALQAGFTSMVVDNIVRGAAVNDYRVTNTQLFGIRNDKAMLSNVVTYGFNVGLVVNRF